MSIVANNNCEPTYKAALEQHRTDNLDDAEKEYQEILDNDPHNADVLHLLSILHAQRQEYQTALYFMEQALSEDPKSATFQNSMGNILNNLHQYQDALTHYFEALRLQPDYAVAHNNIGNVYYKLNRLPEANQHYREALKLDSNFADAHYNLSLILTKQNHPIEAQEHLEQAIKNQPTHAKAHSHLAYLLQLGSSVDAAAKHYQVAIRLNAEDAFSHHNLGVILTNKQKYGAAIRHFKKTVVLQPNYPDALSNLGAIFLLQNNPAAALKYYLRLSQMVRDFDVYYNLGVIYMYLGRNDDAIAYFNEALAMRPHDFAAHSNIGSVYLRKEDFVNAAKHYEAALELQPENKEISYLLQAIDQKVTPKTAPQDYVANLFDQYAPHYEQHLQLLNYHVPELLYSAVTNFLGEKEHSLVILDLGCGTGMIGEKFKNLAAKLIGIDLSARMLALAKNKNLYDELKLSSILEALDFYTNIDLVLAADSFVYVGDLDEVFAKTKTVLCQEGLFAFTIEKTTQYPYVLQRTARFAHTQQYIRELIQKYGFELLQEDETVLRKQRGGAIEGYLYLLRSKTV